MQGHPPERKIPGKMVVPSDPQREQVLKLIAEKDKIEKKIAELGYTLQKVSLPRISILFNFLNAVPITFRTTSASTSRWSTPKAFHVPTSMFDQFASLVLKSSVSRMISNS